MSIVADICLILLVLMSSVVTAPNEIIFIFGNAGANFMLSIGILWLVGVYIRVVFQSHVLPSVVCAMFFFGTGFIAVAFGPFFAILYMIVYIARVVMVLRRPRVETIEEAE